MRGRQLERQLQLNQITAGELEPGEARHSSDRRRHDLRGGKRNATEGRDLVDQVRPTSSGFRNLRMMFDQPTNVRRSTERRIHRGDPINTDRVRVPGQFQAVGDGVGTDVSDHAKILSRCGHPGLESRSSFRHGQRQ